MLYSGQESGANTKMREGSGLLRKYVGFSMHLLGLSSEAERNPLKKEPAE